MQKNRLPEGGRIDRARPITFTFNGKSLTGFAGDTLASALLAGGVRVVGRSFKYHRPRGIYAAGVEEPNALVQLESGARTEPNVKATRAELYEGLAAESVNCWPSVEFDLGAVANLFARFLPAGFYYKTFMWPKSFWLKYEYFIRRAAGLGRAPRLPDPDRYAKLFAHCDVLIAGGGPAGLAAALAAGRTGARVILADEQHEFGGSLLGTGEEIGGAPAADWVAAAVAELERMPEVRLVPRGTVAAYYDHNFLTIVERLTDHLGPRGAAASAGPRQRLWKVRAKQVVLATGAFERPLVFADNDRPGIMLAEAARAYLHRYGVKAGARALVFTNNDGAYGAALDLVDAGVGVAGIVDLRPNPGGGLPACARARGIEIVGGHAIVGVEGSKGVKSAQVMALDAAGEGVVGVPRRIACDHILVSGGWNPAVHLFSQSGGKLDFDAVLGCFVPGRSVQAERSAGACRGTFDSAGCLAEGRAAGLDAARAAGIVRKGRARKKPVTEGSEEEPPRLLWLVPGRTAVGRGREKHFVDVQNDVTAADIALAAREGYRSVEHTKRYTTLGMGPDQGKVGGIAGLAVLARALGKDIPEVGTTTFRPPYTPITYGLLAGRDIGEFGDPTRLTPIQSWHVSAGAVFENAGQWTLPWYYSRQGEAMADAVKRECLAVRGAVGIRDASTLGKIDIRGPDAIELLNWVYTNAWDTLAIGGCRYGLMLGEDGLVMDDGVTARLGEDHYLMHTTTGNAAHVFHWMEEWLQTEWTGFRVRLTSVSEQWATVNLAGPRARDLLAELTGDIDLSAGAFPHMAVREGTVAGIPARVFRVSFSGDLSYEVNVPAGYGVALWNACLTAGAKYGITPFGLEALHVLRAEKGFITGGQEIDGTVTPGDLGLAWIVSKRKKDFLGKRGLARADFQRTDRRQLVGLLTRDAREVLPQGAQIVRDLRPSPPMTMIGYVTSSYYSPVLDRSIALALVEGGRAMLGQTVRLPLPDRTVEAEVADTVFYDPEGGRLHA